MKANEVMEKYEAGEITLEGANKLFEENNIPVRLYELNNVITGAEMSEAIVSDNPEEVTGWGYMDIGIGSDVKMHVTNGKFEHDTGLHLGKVNYPFYIKGKTFWVDGDHIVAIPKDAE